MALGADATAVAPLLTATSLRLVAVGAIAGLVLAVLVSGLLRQILFGVDGLDVVAFVVALGVLLTTALLAAYAPARRASRMAPMGALRTD